MLIAKTLKEEKEQKVQELENEIKAATLTENSQLTEFTKSSREYSQTKKELTASQKTKEREFCDLESEISSLETKQTTLNEQFKEQEKIKESVKVKLKELKTSTNDSN